ncbi:MAG: hypothetical protein J0L92_07060 [Deltaproteobacteria bacterium]|nr:hypothetical protein [Deltaproteobacteria bacterium]
MRRTPLGWMLVVLAGTPGCYLFNSLAGSGASERDAGVLRIDASFGALLDASSSATLDARRMDHDAWAPDSGPPLPREPDPGPDGRPSDDPDGWVDPPELGPDDPCCTLGEPVRVTSRDEGVALSDDPPLIAWGPGRWGLAVTRFLAGEGRVRTLVTYDLSADGTVAGPARTLATPPHLSAESTPRARVFRWAAGRWALVASDDAVTGSERPLDVRFFDASFTPASAWIPLGAGTGVDLTYLAHRDRWLAFTSQSDATRSIPLDERDGVGPVMDATSPWSRVVRAASLRSRAVVLPLDANAATDLFVVDPDGAVLGRLPHASDRGSFRGGSMTSVRDVAVVAVQRLNRVEIEVADPFALRWVTGPSVVGDAGSGDRGLEHGLDVAGSGTFGVAGVCWGVPGVEGRDEESRILFRLVDTRGRPRGAAVTVVSSMFRGNLANCTVGTDDRGFLVGWWNGSELWVRRIDLAP